MPYVPHRATPLPHILVSKRTLNAKFRYKRGKNKYTMYIYFFLHPVKLVFIRFTATTYNATCLRTVFVILKRNCVQSIHVCNKEYLVHVID